MAEVGSKRSPRLSKGPKALEEGDDVVIDAREDGEGGLDGNNTSGSTAHSLSTDSSSDKPRSDSTDDTFKEIKRAKIPEPPSRTIREPQVLYDYLATLKDEHWVQLVWYLYRVWPQIIREDDNKKYIECNAIAFDEDYMLKNHGSGEYMLMLNDSGKPKNAKTMLKAFIKLNDPDYPPMVNMAELDTSFPGNRTFVDKCIAKGLLTVDKKPMNQTNNNQGGMNSDAVITLLGKVIDKLDNSNKNNNQKDPTQDALTAVVTMMKEGNTASTKMLLDQMKESSPNTFVGMIAAIKELLPKETQHKDTSSIDPMKFLELMSKKDETILNLMTKMIEKQNNPVNKNGEDGNDSFDRFMDRFIKMQELIGVGADKGGGGGKKSTLEVVMQYGMPVADKVFGLIQNLLALKAMGAPTNTTGAGTTATTSTAPTLPISISQSPGIQANPNQSVEEQLNNPQQQQQQQQTQQQPVMNEEMIKQGVLELSPKILEAMNRNETGDEFAHNLNGFLGPQAYDIIAGLGEEKIVETIKAYPQAWQLFSMREGALRKFIKAFIAFGSDEDIDTTDAPDETDKEDSDAKKERDGIIN